jgi:hypothetical protein
VEGFLFAAAPATFSPQFVLGPPMTPWDAATAAFRAGVVRTSGLGSSASLLPGSTSSVHKWNTTAGRWAAVGVDILPAPP